MWHQNLGIWGLGFRGAPTLLATGLHGLEPGKMLTASWVSSLMVCVSGFLFVETSF